MSTIERELILPKPQALPTYTAKRAKAQASTHTSGRLFFLDNLRWALTLLVVLHHLSITYGAEGSWYYVEQPIARLANPLATILLTLFTGLNQGYFMGLFFLIAGYFVPTALDRKGTWRFLQDRIVRLGVPLLVYTFVINPPLSAFVQIVEQGGQPSWVLVWAGTLARWQAFTFSPGPLWFVETLLAFSIIYALGALVWRKVGWQQRDHTPIKLTNARLIALALAIISLSFATRLVYPIGAEWNHLQLAFFPQYIALFAGGVLAYRNQWLPQLPAHISRPWTVVAVAAIVVLPAMMMVPGVQENFESVLGGWHLNAFLFATWEGFYVLAMSIALLGLFRRRFNQGGGFSRRLSSCAYTVYIIHAPILVALAYAMRNVALDPLLKFGLLAAPAVATIFAAAYLLVAYIPGAKRVL
jgi:glucans biosynthesis protein C